MAQLKSTTIIGTLSSTGNATIGGDVLLSIGKTVKINNVDVIGNKAEKPVIYTITLPYTDWLGTSAPYSKSVNIDGILATDKLLFELNLSSADYEDISTIQSAWFNVYRKVAGADKITFYSHEVPSIDIPLNVIALR